MPESTAESSTIPQVGMLATVRNRRALVSSVDVFPGRDGNLHLVHLDYTDYDGVPEETVIWEREHAATVVPQTALPRVSETAPMLPRDFDALVRAARWSALTPYLAFDGSGRNPHEVVSSPYFGAVQVEDFQLVPLLKALRMPRVSLLLADDVGLGKTIEAGLVLTELLLRRRVRRVLILCPASLRTQWQEELKDKFSLTFDVVDRAETHALQKRLGLDCNPWRTCPRIISSYRVLPASVHEAEPSSRVRWSPHQPKRRTSVWQPERQTPCPPDWRRLAADSRRGARRAGKASAFQSGCGISR